MPPNLKLNFFEDIDECETEICGAFGNCSNSEGSFVCNCLKGFQFDGLNGCIGEIMFI